MTEAETMRAAADWLRDPNRAWGKPRLDQTLADWLDSAAEDAEMIGPDFRAVRVAAAILGQPDPWPDAPAPRRLT